MYANGASVDARRALLFQRLSADAGAAGIFVMRVHMVKK
jgi:hypothetical protein